MNVSDLHIRTFVIRGEGGLQAIISDYGAKLIRLTLPDREGKERDLVLGFASEDDWLSKEPSLNAVMGRLANRVKNGRFSLDGKTYHLPQNDGPNCLHGGDKGFNTRFWDVVLHRQDSLLLHYRSKNGEEGFPGNVEVQVRYAVTPENALEIEYTATADAPTPFGLTHHAYFNLEGKDSNAVHDHLLQVFADYYTPSDADFCPTGEIRTVQGTPMDFRQPVRIGEKLAEPFFLHAKGINHNWVTSMQPCRPLSLVAVLRAEDIAMHVWTTQPGLQVYTADYIEPNSGRSGNVFAPHCAVCLETQSLPDSPNHPSFPSVILRPGDTYRHLTRYVFSVLH